MMKVIERVATFVPFQFVFQGFVLPISMYFQQIIVNFFSLPLYLDKNVSGILKLNFGVERAELPFDTSIFERLIIFGYNPWHKLN